MKDGINVSDLRRNQFFFLTDLYILCKKYDHYVATWNYEAESRS